MTSSHVIEGEAAQAILDSALRTLDRMTPEQRATIRDYLNAAIDGMELELEYLGVAEGHARHMMTVPFPSFERSSGRSSPDEA